MSYHLQRQGPWGRVSGRGGALSGFWSGMGLGDTTSPVAELVRQVNRFGASAPTSYQIVAQPLLASGNIDIPLATAALTIYQRRATDSYSQFHDAGSAQAIDRANQGFADPVGFVTGNLSDVLSAVTAFADALGLPMTDGSSAPAPGGNTNMLLVAAGIGLLLWMTR